VAAARVDLPVDPEGSLAARRTAITAGLRRALGRARFRGRDAVLCLAAPDLIVQNVRVPAAGGQSLEYLVRQEAAGRLPLDIDDADIRCLVAGDVRHGESVRREVILLAVAKQTIQDVLAMVEAAGIRPHAIDAEPLALVRCYTRQFRREEDHGRCTMYIHVGASSTLVVIEQSGTLKFVKCIDLGGRQMDEAVAGHFNLESQQAVSFRQHHGERRSDRQNAELADSLAEAGRPIVDRLAEEVAHCLRYYTVTFRGGRPGEFVLTGGEACEAFLEPIAARTNVAGTLGNPLRGLPRVSLPGRPMQWDIAAGLAQREA